METWGKLLSITMTMSFFNHLYKFKWEVDQNPLNKDSTSTAVYSSCFVIYICTPNKPPTTNWHTQQALNKCHITKWNCPHSHLFGNLCWFLGVSTSPPDVFRHQSWEASLISLSSNCKFGCFPHQKDGQLGTTWTLNPTCGGPYGPGHSGMKPTERSGSAWT